MVHGNDAYILISPAHRADASKFINQSLLFFRSMFCHIQTSLLSITVLCSLEELWGLRMLGEMMNQKY